MQYRVCPYCGAHLDFGEICDCRNDEKEAAPAGPGTTSGKIPKPSVAVRPQEVKRNGRYGYACV